MTSAASLRHARLWWTRKVCGYGLIVAVVPYAALKVLWLSGSSIGLPDDSPVAGSQFTGANAITLGMDLVAVILALALTQDWGKRLPATPLLITGWVGTGLLVPTVLPGLVGFAYSLLTTGRPVDVDGGLVTANTYVVVYSSFALQGVFLGTAFFCYAFDRWADILGTAGPDGPRRAVTHVRRIIGTMAAACAFGVALVSIVGAVAAPLGWHDQWTAEYRLSIGLHGAVVFLAVPGVLAMVDSPIVPGWLRRRPFGLATTLTWLGSGALFGWGGFHTIVQLARAPMSELVRPVERATDFVAMLSGLTIGLLGILLLAEIRDRRSDHEPLGGYSAEGAGHGSLRTWPSP